MDRLTITARWKSASSPFKNGINKMCLLGEIGEPQDVLRSRAPLDLSREVGEAGLRGEGSLQGDALEMVTTGAEVALSFGEREPVGSLPGQTCIRNLRVGKNLHAQAEAVSLAAVQSSGCGSTNRQRAPCYQRGTSLSSICSCLLPAFATDHLSLARGHGMKRIK